MQIWNFGHVMTGKMSVSPDSLSAVVSKVNGLSTSRILQYVWHQDLYVSKLKSTCESAFLCFVLQVQAFTFEFMHDFDCLLLLLFDYSWLLVGRLNIHKVRVAIHDTRISFLLLEDKINSNLKKEWTLACQLGLTHTKVMQLPVYTSI